MYSEIVFAIEIIALVMVSLSLFEVGYWAFERWPVAWYESLKREPMPQRMRKTAPPESQAAGLERVKSSVSDDWAV